MRIRTIKTPNTVQYAIIQDITRDGKRTTKVYENIGNLEKLKQRAGDEEPLKGSLSIVGVQNPKID